MVSVVIPTYNRGKTIKKSIQSVLNSTYQDIEIIVVDDGSVDDTREIIEGMKDSRIIYIKQNNAGACAARNNGVRHARGEYIAFNDSDDEWLPNKLTEQMKVFRETNAEIVTCLLNNQNKKCNELITYVGQSEKINGISTQTFICKREVFEDTCFDETIPRMQDFDFLISAMEKHPIYMLNKQLVKVNLQEDSISLNFEKLACALKIMTVKYENMFLKYRWLKIRIAELWRHTAKEAYRQKKKNYRIYYIESLKVFPLKSSLIMLFLSYTPFISLIFKYKA